MPTLKQTQHLGSPLAALLRPTLLDDFVGQAHLLGQCKPLRQSIEKGRLHSMILWGPPGTGKTTLANIIANYARAQFLSISAVMAGVKEIRESIQKAQAARLNDHKPTILFVDEVHRFNKAQQDAFLHYVEDGTVTFIGATTENPSFELNNALLSRAQVYVLNPLDENDLMKILNRGLRFLTELWKDKPQNFEEEFEEIDFPELLKNKLIHAADGDARQLLNFLELIISHASIGSGRIKITEELLKQAVQGTLRRFDKGGDNFYDQISALHKSVRGSSPDGALYWFARMLDGGCDPFYITRRVVRMATEDVGNADPRALEIALNAWEVQRKLGSPEGELAIAQAIVYMAVAPKSNAVYTAFKAAVKDAEESGSLPVPHHIRNAPTSLMKKMGNSKGYRYDHNEEDAFAVGQTYFPEKLGEKRYYYPVERGLEIKIKEKLDHLREKISNKTKAEFKENNLTD